MHVNIKRVDNTLPLPKYETAGSVAFDFVVRETSVVSPRGYARIPSNVIIAIPQGYMVWITDRSSTLKKTGLLITEGAVDQDYCGEEDEILLQFYNPTDVPVTIHRGDRIAQGIFLPVGIATWNETPHMQEKSRGGFGSTDIISANDTNEVRINANEKNVDIRINENDLHDSHSSTNDRFGKLIVIDGIDGSGKTTQLAKLAERMKRMGYEVSIVDFPRYTEKSAGMVENYLNGKYGSAGEVSPYVASFFYALDRYDASFAIKKDLADGKIVLSNRYVSASMGHQGGKFNTPDERKQYFVWLDTYEYEVFGIPRPDVNIILHVPAPIAQQMVDAKLKRDYIKNGATRDVHEADLHHLERAEQTYLEMCELFPRFELVHCANNNTVMGVDEIHEAIWKRVEPYLLMYT